MAINPLLTVLRFIGLAIIFGGFLLLAREQRVTVKQGLPTRPRFIALWVAMTVGGAAISVLAILDA